METENVIDLLERSRREEKEQALVYRRMAAMAEEEEPAMAQRFHDLHADEQHHLSRLTARILELGGRPVDLVDVRAPEGDLTGWKEIVERREAAEVVRYTALLKEDLDAETRDLLAEILEVERHHAQALGGKWVIA